MKEQYKPSETRQLTVDLIMSHIGKFGLLGGNFKKPPPRKTRLIRGIMVCLQYHFTCNMHLFRLNRSYDELTPISWREYFDHKRVVEFDGNKFTTYFSGNIDSVLIVLLHGGGFNSLTWALFAVSTYF